MILVLVKETLSAQGIALMPCTDVEDLIGNESSWNTNFISPDGCKVGFILLIQLLHGKHDLGMSV